MTHWTIYALRDPRDGEIRYIGKTSMKLTRRVQAHLAMCSDEHNHRACWLRNLIASGFLPVYQILQMGEGEHWDVAERWWIKTGLDSGWHLTNSTEGGDGTRGMSPEGRLRLSASKKGKRLSLERRAKMSAVRLGKKLTIEQRAALKGRTCGPQTPERRAVSIACLGVYATKGFRQPPNMIAARVAKNRGQHPSPESIAKRKAQALTPEGHARMSFISQLGHAQRKRLKNALIP